MAGRSRKPLGLLNCVGKKRVSNLGRDPRTPMPMQKRNSLDSSQVMYRAEDLIKAATNRYRITVQVANRPKPRRYEEIDSVDEATMKPVIRAIVEMSDELTQPEIISD